MKKESSKKTVGNAVVKERYPKFDLDRGIVASSMRWNVGTVIWYKRLIDASIGLLIIAIAALLFSVFFILKQPVPKLYATSIDGTLTLLPYSKNVKSEEFKTIRERLSLEKKDLELLGVQQKNDN